MKTLPVSSLGLMGHDQPPGQGEGLEALALFRRDEPYADFGN